MSVAFVTLFVAMLMAPLVLTPVLGGDVSSEKRDLAQWPGLVTDEGTVNVRYLSEAGAWLEDHFALRPALVDLDATVRERVFGTSATSNVVVGKDGWLYYSGTLADYRRTNLLSDRAIDNIACNLALMEDYAHASGKGFVVAIAPNKATVYPDSMPYYQQPGFGEGNLRRLEGLLEGRGVTFVELSTVLGNSETTTYLRRDTHWNDEGARLAYDALLDALGKEHEDYALSPREVELHVGDLEGMLHPVTAHGEDQDVVADARRFAYANGATGVEDSDIETTSSREGATGTLMMYRDSFGNALLPYLATAYARASFSKMVPYNMAGKAYSQADDVIVERAERHLSLLGSNPPYLPAPEREGVEASGFEETVSTAYVRPNGPYVVIEGDVEPGYADDGTPIYVVVTCSDGVSRTHEAFHVSPASDETADTSDGTREAFGKVSTDWGYRAYVPASELEEMGSVRVEVLVSHGGALVGVLSRDVVIGEGE